jgi:hypothetical protein
MAIGRRIRQGWGDVNFSFVSWSRFMLCRSHARGQNPKYRSLAEVTKGSEAKSSSSNAVPHTYIGIGLTFSVRASVGTPE